MMLAGAAFVAFSLGIFVGLVAEHRRRERDDRDHRSLQKHRRARRSLGRSQPSQSAGRNRQPSG